MESYVLDETKRMHDISIILKYKRSGPSTLPCSHDTPSSVAVEATAGSTQIGANADTKPPNPPASTPASNSLSYSQIVEGAVAARLTQKKKETTFIVDNLNNIPVANLLQIKVDALRELSERVEQIDNATYFACGAGGSGELPLLFDLLKNGATPLQAEACDVLKVILQNNPKCQAKALKIGGMNALLLVTQTHTKMEMRVKAFSCLSALLRFCGNAV